MNKLKQCHTLFTKVKHIFINLKASLNSFLTDELTGIKNSETR